MAFDPIQETSLQIQRLSEWTQSYQKDFVSHGVVSSNIKAVLSEGRLRCAENVLRRTGKLEFEGGSTSGSREVVCLPKDVLDTTFLARIVEKVSQMFELTDGDIEKLIRDCKPIDIPANWDQKTVFEQLKWQIDHPMDVQQKGYTGSFFKAGDQYERFIKGLIKQNPTLWDEQNRPRELYAVPLLAIYIDKALPKEKRCKAQLKRIFAIYERMLKEKTIDISLIEIRDLFNRIRKCRLADPYKINGEIRVYRNSYAACYGEVRVLIGGAEPLLGSEQWKDTGEYHLLNAGQNRGKFFKVDLSSPNVLVVGPKKAIEGFTSDALFRKNIIFSENIPEACPGGERLGSF